MAVFIVMCSTILQHQHRGSLAHTCEWAKLTLHTDVFSVRFSPRTISVPCLHSLHIKCTSPVKVLLYSVYIASDSVTVSYSIS